MRANTHTILGMDTIREEEEIRSQVKLLQHHLDAIIERFCDDGMTRRTFEEFGLLLHMADGIFSVVSGTEREEIPHLHRFHHTVIRATRFYENSYAKYGKAP